MAPPPDLPPGSPLDDHPAPPSGAAAAAATTGATVLSGGAWSSASALLPQVYTLVLSIVAARALGPDGMGRQSFIAFAEISAAVLLTGGLPIALMRHVGETVGVGRPEHVRRLVSWAWRLEGGAAAVGAGALIAVGLTQGNLRTAWVLAALAAALTILQAVPSSVLIGVQRWKEASVVGLVTGAVGLAAAVVVLALGGGVTGMFAVEVAAAALNLLWTASLARRATPPAMRAEEMTPADDGAALLRRARRYAAIGTVQVVVFFVVQRRSEFFFLQRYSTARQIALYSIVFSATTALVRVPQALAGALAPAVATLYGAGEHARIQVGFGRALRLMVLVTLPLTAGVAALGPTALRLVYGEQYRGTGRVLLVMMIAMPAIPLSSVSLSVLSGLGRQKTPAFIGAVASVVNLSFDAWLIPRHAAVGAAVANDIAQVALAAPLVVYACGAVGNMRWEVAALARAALASAVVAVAGRAVVLHVSGWPGLAGGLAACAVALAALSPALRILPAGDARWLDEAAGRRLRGLVGAVCRACAAST